MNQLKLSSDLIKRIQEFKSSNQYIVKNQFSKSEYWKHFSDSIKSDINETSVNIEGGSGVYIPPKNSILSDIKYFNN